MSALLPVFVTDYDAIIDRVNSIDPIRYASTRNFVDGAVTYLSPYISRGVISSKQVQQITLARGFPPAAIQKLLQELAWREYFQRVWQARGDALFEDIRQPQADVAHHNMPEGIAGASTGIRAIDQAITDLYSTGYMHNHVRMYVASMACTIGKAHWLTPSRWMYAHLLDGDLASNACSWQWVAGAFAAKKYYCNQENINHYTRSTQRHTFLDMAFEKLPSISIPPALQHHAPWHLQTTLPSFAPVTLDVAKPTLLYNSYNLDPLWRSTEHVNRVLLLEPSHFRKYPVSETVLGFILSLAKNIPGLQLMTGEVSELLSLYDDPGRAAGMLISKEHPAFGHYPGLRDERDWIYPQVTGYYPSFSSFWKRCRYAVR
jgi:deoxyribodipyrimidine photo-lyase